MRRARDRRPPIVRPAVSSMKICSSESSVIAVDIRISSAGEVAVWPRSWGMVTRAAAHTIRWVIADLLISRLKTPTLTQSVLGRWMRMFTIPNQSSVAKAFNEFDEAGRMKPSSYYDRVVDVMEELVKFTLLTRDVSAYLTDRYFERKESGEAPMRRMNLSAVSS